MDNSNFGNHSKFEKFFMRPMVSVAGTKTYHTKPKFKVLLKDTLSGFTIQIVDEHLEGVEVSSSDYLGKIGEFVRMYNQCVSLNDSFADIQWGSTVQSGVVSLSEYPEILPMLRDGIEVVNEEGKRITFAEETGRLNYALMSFTGSDAKEKRGDLTYIPILLLVGDYENGVNDAIEEESKEAEETHDAVECNSSASRGVTIVTSEYVYDRKECKIFPVLSVGPNFSNLQAFTYSVITRDDLPSVLTMLLSYFVNITPLVRDCSLDRIEDYEFEDSTKTEKYVPTLVFEEIDSQNALYIRLKATIPGLPMHMSDMGLLTNVERIEGEAKFIVHHFKSIDMEEYVDILEKSLRKSAPTRKEEKEIVKDGDLYILPESMAANFLFHQLPFLLSDFRIVGADKLKSYKVKAVMPKVNVRLSSGIDFLGGSANVTIENETFTLADLIKKYSSQKYLQLADGTRAIIDSDYMRRLERIYKHNRGKKGEFKVSFFDLPEIEYLLDSKLEGEAVKASHEFYNGFGGLKKQKLQIPGLQAKLRPYQAEGVKWINYLYENKIGGCLADDMGLGKTIQTISMLLKVYSGAEGLQPSLIVMPRSLLFNWESELKRFAPTLTFSVYYGQNRKLGEALNSQIVLTTYSVVRNDIELLQKENFHYVILDESQNIKNVSAQATHAVWLLNGEHRLAISGTPIENNLTELYSLFRFLNPAMFGTIDDFNAKYTYPIQKQESEECAEELRRKVFPFILRRLKKNVLSDLPDLSEQVLRVEMEPEHARFYEKRRKEYYDLINKQIAIDGIGKSQFMLFQALSELRRIASIPESLTDGKIASPKIPLLVEKIEDAVAGSHKVVVFFNFIAGLDIAAEHLGSEGIDYEVMTGATQNRQAVVNRFQNDPKCKVLLMTLKTGGVGLNLTAADTVIIFEPWWNKAAELQAINRLHRIGQKAKVMSYSIITTDTIEERILELQQQKSILVDNIISSDGMGKHLTEDDINFILK